MQLQAVLKGASFPLHLPTVKFVVEGESQEESGQDRQLRPQLAFLQGVHCPVSSVGDTLQEMKQRHRETTSHDVSLPHTSSITSTQHYHPAHIISVSPPKYTPPSQFSPQILKPHPLPPYCPNLAPSIPCQVRWERV